jgi:hypothetical protein
VLSAMALAAAACTSKRPRIEIVDISSTVLSQSGKTAQPIEVTYFVEFVPSKTASAEIRLMRDTDIMQTFPAPLKAGTNTITLPSGLQMENPRDVIGVQVELPGGGFSEARAIAISKKEQIEQRDAVAKARFDRLEPSLITKTSSPQVVTIVGTDLSALSSVIAAGLPVPAQQVTGGLRVEIPSSLFDRPGFLAIQPPPPLFFPDWPLGPGQQLHLAVADPTLPPLGGLGSVRIASVDYVPAPGGAGKRDRLQISGEGFDVGMKAVIGRGEVPIVALWTEVRDTSSMSASIRYGDQATDYFIAILSRDGTSLSRPFPTASLDRPRAAAGPATETADEPGFNRAGFRVYGDLIWNNDQAQSFSLEGDIAQSGLRVRLEGEGEPIVVTAEAVSSPSANATHPVVRVPVPAALTRRAEYKIVLALHTK